MKQRLFFKPALVSLYMVDGIKSFVLPAIMVTTEMLFAFDQDVSACSADDNTTANRF